MKYEFLMFDLGKSVLHVTLKILLPRFLHKFVWVCVVAWFGFFVVWLVLSFLYPVFG